MHPHNLHHAPDGEAHQGQPPPERACQGRSKRASVLPQLGGQGAEIRRTQPSGLARARGDGQRRRLPQRTLLHLAPGSAGTGRQDYTRP